MWPFTEPKWKELLRTHRSLKPVLLTQTKPWHQVSPEFAKLAIDVLDGSGLTDSFIFHSMQLELISRYENICRDEFSPEVMRAQISHILCIGSNHAMAAVEKALARGNRDELVKAAMVCGDCYEIALLFEPQQVGACVGLAHLYAGIGRQDKSHEYARRGLAILAETRDTPPQKRWRAVPAASSLPISMNRSSVSCGPI